MVIAVIPVLVAVCGVLMFALATNGKVQQIGLALFTAAMVALMIDLSHVALHLG
jgi:hypothetical protein